MGGDRQPGSTGAGPKGSNPGGGGRLDPSDVYNGDLMGQLTDSVYEALMRCDNVTLVKQYDFDVVSHKNSLFRYKLRGSLSDVKVTGLSGLSAQSKLNFRPPWNMEQEFALSDTSFTVTGKLKATGNVKGASVSGDTAFKLQVGGFRLTGGKTKIRVVPSVKLTDMDFGFIMDSIAAQADTTQIRYGDWSEQQIEAFFKDDLLQHIKVNNNIIRQCIAKEGLFLANQIMASRGGGINLILELKGALRELEFC